MLTVLFDGLASGTLFFVLAVGLCVTMGVMNFVNLAHGSFAMLGGYVAVALCGRAGVPFLASLPLAFVACAIVGAVLERTLYARLYRASHLDQVLFTTGLIFMSMAAASYLMGSSQQMIELPRYLDGEVHVFAGFDAGLYRAFLIAVCAVIAVALQLVLTRTRFGSRLRAAVDNARVARGLGIDVDRLFAVSFAVGSGLAGLGGALGIETLNLDPSFPFKFLVYFLLIVAAGGTGTVTGPLVAAILLGIADVGGKYYLPQFGSFMIYAVMVAILIWRPQGLFGRAVRG